MQMLALNSQDVGMNFCYALHCELLLFVTLRETKAILFYDTCSCVVRVQWLEEAISANKTLKHNIHMCQLYWIIQESPRYGTNLPVSSHTPYSKMAAI